MHLPLILISASLLLADLSHAVESGASDRALQKPVKSRVQAQALESQEGLELQVDTSVFTSRERHLLEVSASTNELLEGESLFYWDGIQVTGGHGEWKDGSYSYSVGIAPARMQFPLVRVPVGPIRVGVDAGVLASADARATLTPELGYPLEMLSLHGEIAAGVTAAAFVEGHARFLIVRGGVGGELRLIDGDAKLSGRIHARGGHPDLQPSGHLTFLQGRLYAFLDTYNFFRLRWKRVFEPTLNHWPGRCVEFGKGETRKCGESEFSSSSPSLD